MSTSVLKIRCDGCKSVKDSYEYTKLSTMGLCLNCWFELNNECVSCGVIKKRKLLIKNVLNYGLYCYKCFSL